jgi:hypothetical protein
LADGAALVDVLEAALDHAGEGQLGQDLVEGAVLRLGFDDLHHLLQRLARARRDGRRGGAWGELSKPLSFSRLKPRSGPAAGGHERFARRRAGRGGRG